MMLRQSHRGAGHQCSSTNDTRNHYHENSGSSQMHQVQLPSLPGHRADDTQFGKRLGGVIQEDPYLARLVAFVRCDEMDGQGSGRRRA
jgi:hypothetical protein